MQRLSAAAGIPQSGEMIKILLSPQLITDYNSKHATGFVSFDQVPYYNPAIASGHLETLTVASHHLQQLTKSAMKKCISNKKLLLSLPQSAAYANSPRVQSVMVIHTGHLTFHPADKLNQEAVIKT